MSTSPTINLDSILSSSNLPTLPSIALKLLDLAKDPESSTTDVTATLKSDPALAAKLLKAANSPLYGFENPIVSTEQAVSVLGRGAITALTLSFSLTDDAASRGAMHEEYHKYWLQSLVQASAAETLAKRLSATPDFDYFLAGLIMDIGALAMLKAIPEKYWSLCQLAGFEEETSMLEIEQSELGFDHVEVGYCMMQMWGMPSAIVEVIKHHHLSVEELASLDDELKMEIRICAFASICGELFVSAGGSSVDATNLEAIASLFDLSGQDLLDFIEEVRDAAKNAGELMSIQTDTLQSSSDLMSEAIQRLADVAIAGQRSLGT